MKKLAILVHGIGVLHGGVGKLKAFEPYLKNRGFDVQEFKYGFLFFFGAIEKNQKLGMKLALMIEEAYKSYEQVVVIGHSNGCAVMEMASIHINNCDLYVYLDAALGVNNSPDLSVKKVEVWFNKKDGVLKFTEIARQIPEWMFRRLQWGKLGLVGFVGTDERVRNHELVVPGINWAKQHSAWFYSRPIWCTKICDSINERLKN